MDKLAGIVGQKAQAYLVGLAVGILMTLWVLADTDGEA